MYVQIHNYCYSSGVSFWASSVVAKCQRPRMGRPYTKRRVDENNKARARARHLARPDSRVQVCLRGGGGGHQGYIKITETCRVQRYLEFLHTRF